MTGEEGPGEDEPGIRIGFKSLEQFPALDTGREPLQVKPRRGRKLLVTSNSDEARGRAG